MTNHQETIVAIDNILNAKSLAVVGVSSNPLKDGYTTLDTIIKGGYKGKLYPVNPRGGEICGVKVYTSLEEIPDHLDTVVIIVRADIVPSIMEQAAMKGAKGAIILSGGFRESGRKDLEDEILAVSQKHQIRVIGPNIQGINYPSNRLCAMMFPVIKTQGPLAVISQSGTITSAISEWADQEKFGISAAINLGNQVDLCESDFLDYFAEHEATGCIVMYLESISNGPRFLKSLEAATQKKPVVILKSGRSTEGSHAAASHTGSMAGNHRLFSAACRQMGALSVNSLTQLYDAARGLSGIRPPKGQRLLIISTSGGMGTVSTDEASLSGLEITPITQEMKEALENLDLLSSLANLSNPLDLIDMISEHFIMSARVADQFSAADTILIAYGDPVPEGIDAVKKLDKELKASIAVCYIGGGDEEQKARKNLQSIGIPVFSSPERAMCGISAAAWRYSYLKKRNLIKEA